MFVAENKKERIGKNTQFWITVLAQQLPNRTEPIQNNATQFSSSSWSPLSAFDSLKSITYFLLSFVRWQYKYRVKYAKVTIIIQEASKRGLGLNLNRNYTFLINRTAEIMSITNMLRLPESSVRSGYGKFQQACAYSLKIIYKLQSPCQHVINNDENCIIQ
ncbi:uncharacterized protein LOC128875311 isoform X1 [Hylaeus volcanicus]|uniref:uncharacterized protein LOC128875311 isoform X1 n=1 Tax=Hylaeus volcanicus TaxID=313075 RepID=UPI0023B7A005|nr:uncharacterized protein LOC128875311 isoform X1 [Hylaeus volcanicus]